MSYETKYHLKKPLLVYFLASASSVLIGNIIPINELGHFTIGMRRERSRDSSRISRP